jgi:hypothetical protein
MAAHVTLAGDLNGDYVVDERLDDGRLVIRPDTSAEAINRRLGVEPISPEEFEQHFGHRRRRLNPGCQPPAGSRFASMS